MRRKSALKIKPRATTASAAKAGHSRSKARAVPRLRLAALQRSNGRKRTKKSELIIRIPIRKVSNYERNKILTPAHPSYAVVSKFKIFDFIKSFSINLTIIALVAGMNWPGLFAIGQTLAYYNDTETSTENAHVAGSLDFSLSAVSDFTPEVTPETDAAKTVALSNDGSLDFQYTIRTTGAIGGLCSSLNLVAELDGSEEYNGPLSGLDEGPFIFGGPESWGFTASLTNDDPDLAGETCDFDFEYSGWQTDLAGPPPVGFSDIEIISNTATAGEWEVDSCVTDPGDTISAVITGTNFGVNGHNLVIASGGELKSLISPSGVNGVLNINTDCDITVESGGKITALKGDGKGGAMTLSARNFTVDAGGVVSASSTASGKDGGSIDLEAVNDIIINGAVSASGHDSGGSVIATAGGDIIVSGSSLTATSINEDGGDILLTATGNIDVPGLISTSAKDYGGTITFLADGNLTVPASGSVLAGSWNKKGGRIEAVVGSAGDISGTLSVDGKDGDGLVIMTVQMDMTVSGTGLISANSTGPGKDGGTIGIKVGGNALYGGTVRANATKNAKSVALWSEGSTAIGGTAGEMISAIGGAGGGNKGGVIDITTRATLSGDGALDASGNVDGSIIQRTVANSFAGVATPAATTESIALNSVVLNEIIPDPAGSDQGSAALPLDGEWVELYNKGGGAVDVNGWVLRDADGNILTISAAKGDNDNDLSDAGETVVPAGGTLTVYRNGAGGLTLDDDGDTVQLMTDASILVDSFTYVVDVGSGNSIARMPDGTGAWVDPEPTPTALNGGINISKLKREFLERLKAAVVEEVAAEPMEEPVAEESAETEEPAAEEKVLPTEENNEAAADASEPAVEAVPPEEETMEESEAVEIPPEETSPAEPVSEPEPATIPEEIPLESSSEGLMGGTTI